MSDRIAVLKDGVVEQIAPPEVLYEEPERAFVARFIGENNRLHGRVVSVDGALCDVDAGREHIRALRVVGCEPGDRVTLSIRPERVSVNPEPGTFGNQVGATVRDLAFLGDHLRVHMEACGRKDFIAKIPNIVGHGGILVGDTVRVGWTVTDCRVLDYETKSDRKEEDDETT